MARIGLLIALALILVAGCAPAGRETPFPATAAPTEAACMAARVEGVLVLDPVSGMGLRLADGQILQVQWAPGYATTDQGLRNAAGLIIANLGDRIEIGGGQLGPWIACPGTVKVLAKASSGSS